MRKNVKISPSQHLGDQTDLEEHIKEIDESVKLGKTISKWTIAIEYPVSQSKLTPKVQFLAFTCTSVFLKLLFLGKTYHQGNCHFPPHYLTSAN